MDFFLLGALARLLSATLVPFCRPAQLHRTAALYGTAVVPSTRYVKAAWQLYGTCTADIVHGVGYCCCKRYHTAVRAPASGVGSRSESKILLYDFFCERFMPVASPGFRCLPYTTIYD